MVLDVVAVEDWVLMRATSTDVDRIAAGAKRKYGDDISLPSTPPVERPTDTASNKLPTYTMLIDEMSTDTHLHLDCIWTCRCGMQKRSCYHSREYLHAIDHEGDRYY
jgi:hypothetical protein